MICRLPRWQTGQRWMSRPATRKTLSRDPSDFNHGLLGRASHLPSPYSNSKGCWCLTYVGREGSAFCHRNRFGQEFSTLQTESPKKPRRQLVDGVRSGHLGRLAAEETVLLLIEATLRGDGGGVYPSRRATTGRQHRLLVYRTKELLACHFERELPLASVADAAGCSPFHLSRIFRRDVGIPLHRYQNLLRVRTALERLREGQDNLTELALDLGFYDHSHFTHVSRQEVASIPSVWCQQRRNS